MGLPANYAAYTGSQAFAGRGSILQYTTSVPSVPYTAAAELKTITFGGMKYDMADVTNFESSNFKEWLPTLADSGDLGYTGNLIPNDVTEIALRGFFNTATLVYWEVVLPPSVAQGYPNSLGGWTMKGYVIEVSMAIPVEKEATITGKIKITGEVIPVLGS